jgi:hypothetical protein
MLTFGSNVVFGAGNFTAASDTVLKVGVLTGINCLPVLGAWLVTTRTGCNELAAACTVILAVFGRVAATVEGVVIVTLPPDVNVLRNISLLWDTSVDISLTASFCLVMGNTIGLKG